MSEWKIRVVKRQNLDLSFVYVIQRNFYPSWLEVTRRSTLDEAMVVVESLRKTTTLNQEVVYVE